VYAGREKPGEEQICKPMVNTNSHKGCLARDTGIRTEAEGRKWLRIPTGDQSGISASGKKTSF